MGAANFPDGDWNIRLISPPANEPIGLTAAKVALRVDVDITDDDGYIGGDPSTGQVGLIASARAYLEQAYDIKIVQQSWEMALSQFPRGDRIRLPFGPVQSILYMTFQDTGYNVQELTVSNPVTGPGQVLSRLSRKPAELVLPFGQIWPPTVLQTADAIRIGIVYGWVTGQSPELLPMPPNLIQAMYMLMDHWYENRSATAVGALNLSTEVSLGVDQLMSVLGFKRY